MAEQKEEVLSGPLVECRFVKTDPKLIERISIKRAIPINLVYAMMRYNMFTVNQYVQLTGLPQSTVTNKSRPNLVNGEIVFELKVVYPFQDSDGVGPKFILRNKESEKYLSE